MDSGLSRDANRSGESRSRHHQGIGGDTDSGYAPDTSSGPVIMPPGFPFQEIQQIITNVADFKVCGGLIHFNFWNNNINVIYLRWI